MHTRAKLLYLLVFILPLSAKSQTLKIHHIQSNTALSPYLYETITTENNIVTAIQDDIVYIQTPDADVDSSIETSEGIAVDFTSIEHSLSIGDAIDVTGVIREVNYTTSIDADSYTLISSDNPLPQATLLDDQFPSPTPQEVNSLEQVESMRVSLPQGVTVSSSNSGAPLYVVAGALRSFREPGIDPASGNTNDLIWDGNPEIFLFRPYALGLDATSPTPAGMPLSAEGILIQDGIYEFWPTSYELDDSYDFRKDLRTKTDEELTIGSINMKLFFDTENTISVRIPKFARYIVESLGQPDVLAVQEVENEDILNDLIAAINELNPSANYTAYVNEENQSGFPINLGFLVSNKIEDPEITPIGENETNANGGYIHDRTPLLLSGSIDNTPFKVLNIHCRSLRNIEQYYTQSARHQQAISIALMANSMQEDNLFIVGDFNAFQFSDGYVDLYNQIAGTPSLGAIFEIADVSAAPLITYVDSLPIAERYSYIYENNSQLIDHVLSTPLEGLKFKELSFARGNVDSPNYFAYVQDDARGVSDHDGFVIYLETEILTSLTSDITKQPGIHIPNPFRLDSYIQVDIPTATNLELAILNTNGQIVKAENLGNFSPGQAQISINIDNLATGLYLFQLKGAAPYRSQLIWVDN